MTGEPVASPALGKGSPDDFRVVFSGFIKTGKFGEMLDALYRTDQSRQFRLKHSHLEIRSPQLLLLSGIRSRHLYVYGLPANEEPAGKKIVAAFSGLADRFGISPHRLLQETTGKITVSIYKKGPAPGSPSSGCMRSASRYKVPILAVSGLGLLFLVFLLLRARSRSRSKQV